MLRKLLKARTGKAFGEQHDYFDDKNIVGWTREGDDQHPDSWLAVLLANGGGSSKRMYVDHNHSGAAFVDLMGGVNEPVIIDGEGHGQFKVNGGSVSVWARKSG